MFAVQVGILLLSLIITGPVYTACHVEHASFTESLSIPLQQIACVVSNGRQLSAEQEMLIDDVVDTSLIPEYYNPVISDPIKALVSYNHADAIIRNPSNISPSGFSSVFLTRATISRPLSIRQKDTGSPPRLLYARMKGFLRTK